MANDLEYFKVFISNSYFFSGVSFLSYNPFFIILFQYAFLKDKLVDSRLKWST